MRKIVYCLILISNSIFLFSQVSFELDFSLEKFDQDDELSSVQLFDYNGDGTDEVITSYYGLDYCRIICHTQEGDTLITFYDQYDYPFKYGRSNVFMDQNNNVILMIVVSNRNLSDEIHLELYDFQNLSLIDSLIFSTYYGSVFGINDILILEYESSHLFYVGIEDGYLGEPEVNNSMIYKFQYVDSSLIFLEGIYNYGLKFYDYSNYDSIIVSGEYTCSEVGAWPSTSRQFRLCTLSHGLNSNVTQIFSVGGSVVWSDPPSYNHYPTNYSVLNLNDEYYSEYGLLDYFKTIDSDDGTILYFQCYEPDFANIQWSANDSNIGSSYIISSTCIPVNSEDHYVMYFRGNQLEIRDRIDGSIIHFQEVDIPPFDILRKSDNELLFITETETGCDFYTLAEDIQVTISNGLINNTFTSLSNSPNPFNPFTEISFSIPHHSDVELSIYNIKGQPVKKLLNRNKLSGNHSIIWNGKNEMNQKVDSGLYFIKLTLDNKVNVIKKCLLIK